MDELTYYADDLKRLAPRLIALKRSRYARLHYHALADAVYWSDEWPSNCSENECDAMRMLLHCRTMLIVGKIEDDCRQYYDHCRQLFPEWIGFHPSRLEPNHHVITFYQQAANAFDDELRREFGDE